MERRRDVYEEDDGVRDGDGEGGASASYEEEAEEEQGQSKGAVRAEIAASRCSSSSYSHNKRVSAHSSRGGLSAPPYDHQELRRQLKESLKIARSLITRLDAREMYLRSKQLKGGGAARVCDERLLGQGSGSGGEGADSAQPSLYSGQEKAGVAGAARRSGEGFGGPRRVVAGDAFTKERSAVGARMALASNGSADSRGRGKKREHEVEGGNLDPSTNKRPKTADLNDTGEQTGVYSYQVIGSHSRRGGSGTRPAGAASDVDVWGECSNILDDLLKNKNAWAFEKPVLVIWPNLVDYSKRIKSPMDLGTVKSKLQNGEYSDPHEFAADVRLIFTNALAYNEEGSLFYIAAQQMKQRFDLKFRSLGMKLARALNRSAAEHKGTLPSQVETVGVRPPASGVLIQSGKAANQPKVVPSPVHSEEKQYVTNHVKPKEAKSEKIEQKTKSKVQGLDKPPNSRLGRSTSALAYGGVRPLTAKERERLPSLIESLPADRVKKVVEILRQRNPACLESATGEVELDLGKFDEETMFELHRLAMNWQKSKKKVLSRMNPSDGVDETALNNGGTSVSGIDHPMSPQDGRVQPGSHGKSQQNRKNEDNGFVQVSPSLGKDKNAGPSGQEVSGSASESSSSSGSSSENSSSSGSGSDSESDADSEQSSQKP